LDEALALAVEAAVIAPGQPATERVVHALESAIDQRRETLRADCDRCLDAAGVALAIGDLSEAERLLESARGVEPDEPRIRLLGDKVLVAREAASAVESTYRNISAKIAEARSLWASGHHDRAIDQLQIVVTQCTDAGPAQGELTRLIERNNQRVRDEDARANAARLFEEAERAWASEDADTALRLSEMAVAQTADHPGATYLVAMAKARVKDIADRRVRAARSAELLTRSVQLFEQVQHDRALEEAHSAIDLWPTSEGATHIARIVRAQMDERQRDSERDEAHRRRTNARLLTAEAKRALDAGDATRAKHVAEEALTLDADDSDAVALLISIAGRDTSMARQDAAALSSPDDGVDGSADPNSRAPVAKLSDLIQRARQGASSLAGVWRARAKTRSADPSVPSDAAGLRTSK
jgi:tetratricopeptide (TPR) repeat protein